MLLQNDQESSCGVIPAKAGIQEEIALLDPGFRRGDGLPKDGVFS
jgi:hypothetical protein